MTKKASNGGNVQRLVWSVDWFDDLSSVFLRSEACGGYRFDINAADRGGFELTTIDDDTDETIASTSCRTIDEAKAIAEEILAQLLADMVERLDQYIDCGAKRAA